MIFYDEHGNTISQFLTRYNKFKYIFKNFKKFIKSDLDSNDRLGISVESETEKTMILSFADRKFSVEFSIFKSSSNSYLGKLLFCELKEDEDQSIISTVYFDNQGNVKETSSEKYSDINITQPESPILLLKYWFVKFIEKNAEIEST